MKSHRLLPLHLSVGIFLVLVAWTGAAAEASPAGTEFIRELNIVHFSHTDVGFTDHPDVCRELYRRYLDIALDTVSETSKAPAGEQFLWTAEATMPVNDWWQAASPARRKQFLKAVRGGQIEITALPFNNTPFLDGQQWQAMLHWLPEEVWKEGHPQVAVQNDVNGFPGRGPLCSWTAGSATFSPGSTRIAAECHSQGRRRFGGRCRMAGACSCG